jgi:hypothetical protein
VAPWGCCLVLGGAIFDRLVAVVVFDSLLVV